MATRAVWRTVPGDPRSPLGWAWRDRRRWAMLGLGKVYLALALLAFYALLVGRGYAILPLILAAGGLVSLFPNPEGLPEAADPAPDESFRGVVQIFRDGAWLGEDRVIATFVDGWLHVEGFRTAFALRSVDVADYPPSRLEDLRHQIQGGSSRPRKEPKSVVLDDGLELRFNAIPCRRQNAADFWARQRASFDETLVRWAEGPSPVGESILPPGGPHPFAWARAATGLAVSGVTLFLALFLGAWYGARWAFLILLLVPGPPLPTAFGLRRAARKG